MTKIILSDSTVNQIAALSEQARVNPELAESVVCNSALGFLNGTYMRGSEWFQKTPVHAFAAADFKSPDGPTTRVWLHLKVAEGPSVVSPDEHPLDDDYHVQRVLAETGVDFPEA